MVYSKHLLLRSISAFLMALLSLLLSSTPAYASGSYDVQASVPYAAPTMPAVFNSGLDGLNSSNAQLNLTGSCQVANPAFVVSIWRAGTSIGSAPCVNGSFSLTVMLVEGSNQLIARTANVSNLYGPDSTTATITLQVITPTPVTPTSPATPTMPLPTSATSDEPATPAEVTAATNAAVISDLQATTVEPFSPISDDKTVTIGVTVMGGTSPYSINLNWGDGSVESHVVESTGLYTYSHTYERITSYQVHGTIHDVLGAMTVFDYAVVSKKPTATVAPKTGTAVNAGNDSSVPLLGTIAFGSVAIAGLSFWLGAHGLMSHPTSPGKSPKAKRTVRKAKPKARRGKK